ncbi:BRCA1-associated ATM activator 1 [Haplosporangium sp. Z 767]|nr:BRCA1-associated ATM activator 1 [Haplosporangium sp. Z 11]KAF9180224.1 BRCA1-associated ATM activator 1 [Haplosporangium sp. Z 767]
MPKNIVDDTRHEKVLSYVSAFISQRDPVLMRTMMLEWAILDIFQACLAPGQDYRVSCVALRLLGYLLKYDTSPATSSSCDNAPAGVWQTLETKHSSILEYMIENTKGDEALVRFSCWFALEQAVKYDSGAQWLLKTGRCADMVSRALKDSSTYVVTATCQFLVAIIENRSIEAQQFTAHDTLMDTLLGSISLYKLIRTMMTDKGSERNRVAGLEFLWMVTNARSECGTAFMQQSQLFFNYMDLLMDDSRLVRSRALDVLSTLLESASNPLSVLGKDDTAPDSMHVDISKDQAMVDCFSHLLEHNVFSLLAMTESLKALHVATGIMDAMIKPLSQCEEMHGTGSRFKDILLSVVLWIIQALQENNSTAQDADSHINVDTIMIPGGGKLAKLLNQSGFQTLVRSQSCAKPSRDKSSRGGTLPKTIVLSALKALQCLAQLFPEAVEKSAAINVVLSILFDEKLCSDQRVFKACLTTLPVVLKTKVQNGQLLDEHVFASAMKIILKLIQRPTNNSTTLRLILTAIQEFFADGILGSILVQERVGQQLANGLSLKLYDMEWDVRDNVVEFIGNLFVSDAPVHGIEWALKHDLLEAVFQKLSDEEAYVRAASVHAFEIVMRDSRGWRGMCAKNLEERLSSQLPSLIRDSEAFVRRAVLEAMICLVGERESGTILMVNGTDLFVDAKFMSRLTLDDSDWEVRIRACEFIAAVWEHCLALDERADYRVRAAKRLKDSGTNVQGDGELLARPSTWWFYDIKGDQILIEATRDSSRLVRFTSVETLKRIKASIEERQGLSTSNVLIVADQEEEALQRKREFGGHATNDELLAASGSSSDSGQHPHAKFYAALCQLDFERLDASTSVEQLYEEVLNVERVEDVVMEENEQPNDGNNVLDCY